MFAVKKPGKFCFVFVEGLSLFLVPPYCFTRQDVVESLEKTTALPHYFRRNSQI